MRRRENIKQNTRTYNGVSPARPQPRGASNIHNSRAALETRDCGPGDVIRPPQVRIDEQVKVGIGRVLDGHSGRVDTGAVEDAVDAAIYRDGVPHGGVAVAARADVARAEREGGLAELVGQLGQPGPVDVA